MKTLDEVIKVFELEELSAKGRYEGGGWYLIGGDELADALHYLYELKLLRQTPTMQGIHKMQKDYALYPVSDWGEDEPDFNPPLTWDELKQMEGKPVWVEVLSDEIDLSSRWMLVARETKAHSLPLTYTDDIGHWIFGHEDELGRTWQAYRKERE